ncbi:MAG: UDP-N-acetylmuramate dehydrogenase [Candidatus Dadabacteria bacterium]|nr:MAG: UDP-N-acetylmuramate dehydrogenase [Candidatus Dadabacteria bacterium]
MNSFAILDKSAPAGMSFCFLEPAILHGERMSSQKHWRKLLIEERRHVDPAVVDVLREIVGPEHLREHEPLSGLTTWRTGGPADVVVRVPDLDALSKVQQVIASNRIPSVVLGRGSNVLVQDGGFRGVVITLGPKFSGIDVEPLGDSDRIHVGAATPLGQLIKAARQHGWRSLAPLGGTPGTVGGALRMNAGDRHTWIGQFVESVDIVKRDGKLTTVPVERIGYGYRHSQFPPGSVIVSGILQVERDDPSLARQAIDEHIARRKATQPLNLPSCGSVFRNPENGSAGELIERAGLKGVRLHAAQISEQHANFIVNLGGATARDILALIRLARQKVYEETGIRLEEEVRIIGDPAEEHDDED